MSKSLGNVVTIQDILSWTHRESMRFFFLSSHYRSPVDYTPTALSDATKALVRIYETLARIDEVGGTAEPDPGFLSRFRKAMDDDFNTPRVLGLIFDEVRRANRLMDSGSKDQIPSLRQALRHVAPALGIMTSPPERFLSEVRSIGHSRSGLAEAEIEERIRERDRARANGEWKIADAIRSDLASYGIVLEDHPEGTRWRSKQP
jgi:cysteinyl-tRNA synthetase